MFGPESPGCNPGIIDLIEALHIKPDREALDRMLDQLGQDAGDRAAINSTAQEGPDPV